MRNVTVQGLACAAVRARPALQDAEKELSALLTSSALSDEEAARVSRSFMRRWVPTGSDAVALAVEPADADGDEEARALVGCALGA